MESYPEARIHCPAIRAIEDRHNQLDTDTGILFTIGSLTWANGSTLKTTHDPGPRIKDDAYNDNSGRNL